MVLEASKELATVIESGGLAQHVGNALIEEFSPLFEEGGKVCAEAALVKVTDATQVAEMKRSRALRLQLKEIRVNADKARKRIKDESLRTGRTIDDVYKLLAGKIEPEEKRLEEQEKFAERAEAARIAALVDARRAMLAPYAADTGAYNLGAMTADAFDQLLAGLRTAHENRLAAAAKAEADRIEAEKVRKAEEARVRAENERLRQEAEAKERELKAERDKAAAEARAAEEKARAERAAIQAKADAERAAHEKVLEAERKARAQLEADAQAAREREAKKAAAEARAKKAAERAPDNEKLRALANAIRAIPIPACASAESKAIATWATGQLKELADRIEAESNSPPD